MALKHLPVEQRPREKLLARGAQALADSELLALLLRTGYAGHDVFALAQQVLQHFGGFHGLLHAQVDELRAIKGLGPAKRAELAAVMEIARRALAEPLREAPVFDAPQQVKAYVALQLGGNHHEVFAALFLDNQHRLLHWQEMFSGTLTQVSVFPRELARRALQLHAAAIIVAHNHPSGEPEPSRADELLTQQLKSALQLIDVRLLDHLVVGRGQVVSLAERGLM